MFQAEFLKQAPNKNQNILQPILNSLVERYNEPPRHYHNMAHIENGLRLYHEMHTQPLSPVDFFTWAYHDSVYDSTRSDNENKSAELFLKDSQVLGFKVEDIDKVIAGILSTNLSEEPLGVVNDLDLSGLGSDPTTYAQNTENIRKEYSWVSPDVWRTGRTAVLRQLLQRPTLYVTVPFFDCFTDQAIINMTEELEQLNLGRNGNG